MPAGLDDDDRLDPRGRARRRHELARVLDRFDVEQDRAGRLIEREIVEQIAESTSSWSPIETMPEKPTARCAAQSTMPAAMAPDCEISARSPAGGIMRGKARIELTPRHHDAKAVRADQPHAVFLRGALRGLRQRARTVAEPGADDDRARRTAAARLIDQAWNGAGRRGEDNEFGRKSQFCDAADGRDTIDLAIARIDEAEFALELGFANIVENGAADRAMARTGPDQRDGMRRKQIFQAIGGHRSPVLAGRGAFCEPRQMFSAM